MNTISWILIAAIAAVCIAIIVITVIRLSKMSPEKRVETLITYLKGVVAWAEKEIIGSKRGEEKIQAVEEYFNKNASWFLKLILTITGKEKLKDLIEMALEEVKKSFSK